MRRYTVWGGNPNGTPEDKTRCVVAVYPPGPGCLAYQCRNKRKHGELCGIHERQRIKGRWLHIPENKA